MKRIGIAMMAVLGLSGGVAMAKKPATPTATAPAATGVGTKAVKDANDTISKLLQEKADPAKVTASVQTFLDVDELGKQAMKNQWDKLTGAQQKQFLDLLHKLIEANYANGMKANVNYTVTYKGETAQANGDIKVNTEITATKNKKPITIKIDYTLKQSGKTWRCYDIATDGVGLVENYRTMFDKIMGSGGFDKLIGNMQKTLDKMNAKTPTTGAAATSTTTGAGAGTGGGGGKGTGGGGGKGTGGGK